MSESSQLLVRLLNTPDLVRTVPRLPAEILHRVIDHCGLEACAEIVALATPQQLRRVLDIDLWRPSAAGADEAFDGARFGEWVELLVEMGPEVAAERVAAMEIEVVVAGLADHVAVFDAAAVAPFTTLDGEAVEARPHNGHLVTEIAGFVLHARRPQYWEAVIELLTTLRGERPALLARLLRGCVALSDGDREQDGCDALLDAGGQHASDLALGREGRRDRQGFVAPAQGRAFCQASRGLRLDGMRPPVDAIARGHFRDLPVAPPADEYVPAASPIPVDAAGTPEDQAAMASVMEILSEAGVTGPRRALLTSGAPSESHLDRVQAVAAHDPAAPEALSFLTNALLSGGSLQARRFTPPEASEAVLATCNLGLENWPTAWGAPDLVTAFQIGWTLLYQDVCRHAARTLADVLARLECADRDVQWSLQTLRQDLLRHLGNGEPWLAAPALDALLALDTIAWAVLVALIAECPAVHVAMHSTQHKIDPTAATFVSRNADIAAVRVYLDTLESRLAG
jgi:hypothetical protein